MKYLKKRGAEWRDIELFLFIMPFGTFDFTFREGKIAAMDIRSI